MKMGWLRAEVNTGSVANIDALVLARHVGALANQRLVQNRVPNDAVFVHYRVADDGITHLDRRSQRGVRADDRAFDPRRRILHRASFGDGWILRFLVR